MNKLLAFHKKSEFRLIIGEKICILPNFKGKKSVFILIKSV